MSRGSLLMLIAVLLFVGCQASRMSHSNVAPRTLEPIEIPREAVTVPVCAVQQASASIAVPTDRVDEQQEPDQRQSWPSGDHPTPASNEAGSIEEFVALGLLRNPTILAAEQQIEAARYRLAQAGTLPDPMLNTTTYLAPVQTAAGEQAFGLGISQKVVAGHRRRIQQEIAQQDLAQELARLEATRLDVAQNIRIACLQLQQTRQAVAVVQEDLQVLTGIEEIALRQYETRKSVTQQDVLFIQTEQSKIENQLTHLRQQEKRFAARLSRLLHLSPISSLTIEDSLDFTEQTLAVTQLIEAATEQRPELKAQAARLQKSRRKICLAESFYQPDFTVGLNWIATSSDGISPVANGDDAWLMNIGFNLPVDRHRIQAAVNEAQAGYQASENRLLGLQDQVAEEVFVAIADLEGAGEMWQLLRDDIIPKNERTLELALEEYSAGQRSYLEMMQNWRELLKYRLAEVRMASEYHQAATHLRRALGH